MVERASDNTIGRTLKKHSQAASQAAMGDSARHQRGDCRHHGRRPGSLSNQAKVNACSRHSAICSQCTDQFWRRLRRKGCSMPTRATNGWISAVAAAQLASAKSRCCSMRYDIHATYIHRGRKTERGYRVEHFAKAFRHYLPEFPTRKLQPCARSTIGTGRDAFRAMARQSDPFLGARVLSRVAIKDILCIHGRKKLMS